jgi:hypothetical protein
MTTTAKPRRLGKADILARWESLSPDQPLRVSPIASDHTGSNYDQDTMRILGSLEFIDSILSRLQGLLEFDSGQSRLELTITETVDRNTGNLTGAWACYIRIKERGTKRPGAGRKSKRSENAPNGFREIAAVVLDESSTLAPTSRKKQTRATTATPAPNDPIEQAPVIPTGKSVIPKGDTWFAIGTVNTDEDDGFTWYEPSPMQSPPMDVYETQEEVSNAIEKIKKKDKKSDVQPVFVKSLGKGKYQYT